MATHSGWQQSLREFGANLEDGILRDFGDPQGELAASRTGKVLADLSHLGVLEFAGADSEAFLQGQLSCDLRSVTLGSSAFGSHCNARGRMFASFLLWRESEGYRMALSRDIASQTQKRLRRYVLRSKVQISDISDSVALFGVSGEGAHQALGKVFAELPQRPLQVTYVAGRGSLVAVPGGRYMAAVTAEHAPALWRTLASDLRPVGTPCWEWLDIINGLPLVTARALEQFVPQMANFDLIGGVSFNKGCYPGQEVVARTQYIGKVKRRMFLAHLDAGAPPLPGDEVYTDDLPGRAAGAVVNSQPSPEGGYDLLATMQLSSRASARVHLRSVDGPPLTFLDLPYPVT